MSIDHTRGEHLLSIEEIHERELTMMKIFINLCNENNLRYYMAGGTLLGAVRHKGFIPWDDDIDLLMPRPDYDRLQQIISSQPLMPRYSFNSSDLGNLNDPMCKIFDLDTRVDKKYIDDSYDRYLWIDIFPMDGLPDDDAEICRIYRKVLAARKRLRFVKAKNGTGANRLKAVVKPVLKPFAKLIWGKKRTVRYIERIAKKYLFEESDNVAGIVFGYGPQESCPRKEYVNGVLMDFGDCKAMAPGCYEHYLTSLFGDYMELPPEDKRQVHFMKIYGW